MNVLGYVRVSTEEQGLNGNGLAAQEAALVEACARRGWTLAHTYRDSGLSGKTLERPELARALERIASGGADGLIVAKLDRLTRSAIDFSLLLEWFEEAHAALVALDFDLDTSTPSGRLVGRIMADVAEWEREVIGQRTRDGLAQVRLQGRPISGASVVDDPVLVARIRGLRGEGLSLRAICECLDADGVRTLRGGSVWRPSAVQGVLGYRRRPKRRTLTVLPKIERSVR